MGMSTRSRTRASEGLSRQVDPATTGMRPILARAIRRGGPIALLWFVIWLRQGAAGL